MATKRSIGKFQVGPVGLGAMPVSMKNGGGAAPEEQAIATVHAALDAGVTHIDTANIYAPSWDSIGHNERLIAQALASYPGDTSGVVIASKGGIVRFEGEKWGRDASPGGLRAALEASLTALGRDTIDLYYLHRPDRNLVYASVIESLALFREEGLIREIGVSNANVEEIEIALDVLGQGNLAAVQNEFSPRFNHTSFPELEYCGRHGVAFLPWSPLGGTGGPATKVGERYPVIADIAAELGVSPQQVTLAWELALGSHVIVIPGASRPESIVDSAGAADLILGPEHMAALSAALL